MAKGSEVSRLAMACVAVFLVVVVALSIIIAPDQLRKTPPGVGAVVGIREALFSAPIHTSRTRDSNITSEETPLVKSVLAAAAAGQTSSTAAPEKDSSEALLNEFLEQFTPIADVFSMPPSTRDTVRELNENVLQWAGELIDLIEESPGLTMEEARRRARAFSDSHSRKTIALQQVLSDALGRTQNIGPIYDFWEQVRIQVALDHNDFMTAGRILWGQGYDDEAIHYWKRAGLEGRYLLAECSIKRTIWPDSWPRVPYRGKWKRRMAAKAAASQ